MLRDNSFYGNNVDESDSSSAEFFAFAFTTKVKEDLAHQCEENAS
jgi:hypothetical protein